MFIAPLNLKVPVTWSSSSLKINRQSRPKSWLSTSRTGVRLMYGAIRAAASAIDSRVMSIAPVWPEAEAADARLYTFCRRESRSRPGVW